MSKKFFHWRMEKKNLKNNSACIRQSTPSSYFSYSFLTTFSSFLDREKCAAGDDTYISFFRIFLYSLKVRHTYVLRHSGWLIYTSGVLYHSLSLIENRYSREREREQINKKRKEREKIYSIRFCFFLIGRLNFSLVFSLSLLFSLSTTTTKKFNYTAVYVSVLDRLPTGVIIAVSIARSW